MRASGVRLEGARGQAVANPSLAALAKHRTLFARLFDTLFGGRSDSVTENARKAARARWNR